MEPHTPAEAARRELGEIVWQELLAGNYEAALERVKSEENADYLRNNSLELVPIVARLLEEEVGPQGEVCVGDILQHIASVASPKEVVLVLLEMLEMSHSAALFRVTLPPLQSALFRQSAPKNTRAVTFSWVFNALYSHVAALDLPQGLNLEGKERQLLDMDPLVREASGCVQDLVRFYEGIFSRVVSGELAWGGGKDSRQYLAAFLLQLFHKPLTQLDVCDESAGVACSALYLSCRSLASMVGCLMYNVFKLFPCITWAPQKTILAADTAGGHGGGCHPQRNEREEGSDSEEAQVSQLSLACFFYCVVGQGMAGEWVPQVYSPHYLFLSCLPLLATLLQETEHIPIHKGLTLARALQSNLATRSLPGDSLEADAHLSFLQLLVRVMTFCDNRELRVLGLEAFRSQLRKFDGQGRRRVIQALVLSVTHAGVLGLLIHELKENVASSLAADQLDPNFSGGNLRQLVRASCVLPEAERTDLLEWSDCIMAALNLLIYLFLRDKDNRTGIHSLTQALQEGYLAQLQTGLDLTRAHYGLKMKDLAQASAGETSDKMSVSVGGQLLPNLPRGQEKKVVEAAVCSLDMMLCVLGRAVQAVERRV